MESDKLENSLYELKKKLYASSFDYVEKSKGACFYAQHVVQYMNGVEKLLEEQEEEIRRLKFVVSKFSGTNVGINQSVTDYTKGIGLNFKNNVKPHKK